MSDLSLKEKLGARLHVAPPASLSEGALFPDERTWSEFLATTAADPAPFFLGLAGELAWRAAPTSAGAAGDWFPGGILLAMGVVMVLGSSDWLEWIWPVALLLGGGVVIFLALRRKQETHE